MSTPSETLQGSTGPQGLAVAVAVLERRAFNNTAPVSRFPPEILGRIFQLQVSGEPPRDRCLSSLRVARVCHYWREVALDYSRLWTQIWPTAPRECLAWQLKQSKGALLTIELDASNATAVELVGPHLARVERLAFNISDVENPVTFGRIAPQLRNLTIRLSVAAVNTSQLVPFDEDAPKLSQLELINTDLKWSSIVFSPTLVLLAVKIEQATSLGTFNGVTFCNILDVLRTLPRLRSLHLSGALPAVPPSETSNDGHIRVHMASLEYLYVQDDPRRYAHLLSHLEIPSVENAVLRASTPSIDVMAKHITRCIATKLLTAQSGIAKPVKTIHVVICGGTDRHLAINLWLVPVFQHNRRMEPFLSIHLHEDDRDNILNTTLQALDLRQTVAFVFMPQLVHRPTLSGWRQFGDAMPDLRELVVGPAGDNEVFRALSPFDPLVEDQNTVPLAIFPKLHTLYLISLRHIPEEHEPIFSEVLESRSANGMPLSKLVIRCCHSFKKEEVRLMGRHVGVVDWDMVESPGDDHDAWWLCQIA